MNVTEDFNVHRSIMRKEEKEEKMMENATACYNGLCIMCWWVEMMYQEYPDQVMKALEELELP